MGFLIFVAICMIIGFFIAYSDYGDFGDGFLGVLSGLFIGLILSFCLAVVLDSTLQKEYYVVEKSPIYALQDGSNANGNFFLGSGYVKGEMRYTYISKTDKGMEIKSIDTEGNYVKEDNSKSPNIVTYASRHKSKIMGKLFPTVMDDEYKVITIPEHSIKYNYNVDLK